MELVGHGTAGCMLYEWTAVEQWAWLIIPDLEYIIPGISFVPLPKHLQIPCNLS